MIELLDIISIEEADDVTKNEVDLEHVVILMLTYGEVFIVGKYAAYKKLWLEYKKRMDEKSGFINVGKN